MKKFSLLCITPLVQSKYISPQQIHYTLDAQEYRWDFYTGFDSVGILLFLPHLHSLLLLKHYRPCAFLRGDGVSYELCAGLVDKKGKSLEEIAQEEILEECGYAIPTQRLEKIQTFFGNIGLTPSQQTLFFATIHSEEKIAQGGGEGEENFEPFLLKTCDILDFLNDLSKPKTTSLAYMLQWFYINKMEKEA